MENSYQSNGNGNGHGNRNGNGNGIDPSLQLIRHPSYQLSSRVLVPWFDIRVFYVRISNLTVNESTPECLTLNHIPLSPNTVLEVNGVRCSSDSGVISCVLRRDRVDKKSEEATFVGTDSIRLTGSVKFGVFDGEELLISGVLEMSNKNGLNGETDNAATRWNMSCEPAIAAGTRFLKGKQATGSESIEVYVAGCSSGDPIVLTKNVKLNQRKKHKNGTMNSIPEYDATESRENNASRHDLQVSEYTSSKSESEEGYNTLYWRQTEHVEGEDGELSWFNAGVRVGVGIGLGVCLGIGIGVGLLVRTYHTTTGTFRRRFV